MGVSAVAIASRTTIETRTQEISIDSSQARLAAEAGLEEALARSQSGDLSRSVSDRASYMVTESQDGDDLVLFDRILPGEVIEATLSGSVGNIFPIRIYWSGVPSGQPKILVSILDSAGVIRDTAIAPTGDNGFSGSLGSATIQGKTYDYSQQITSVTNPVSMTLTLMGDDATIAIAPAVTGIFAHQFVVKRSVGSVDMGNEAVKHGIEYRQSNFDSVPDVFNFALFSGTDIIQ
jgi:hypothetical protein